MGGNRNSQKNVAEKIGQNLKLLWHLNKEKELEKGTNGKK